MTTLRLVSGSVGQHFKPGSSGWFTCPQLLSAVYLQSAAGSLRGSASGGYRRLLLGVSPLPLVVSSACWAGTGLFAQAVFWKEEQRHMRYPEARAHTWHSVSADVFCWSK